MMNHLVRLLPLAVSLPLSLAQEGQPAAAPAQPEALRATIRGAVTWIAKQAVPVAGVDGAVLFPGTAGDKGRPVSEVYGGTAGVLIFLENAAAVLDDAAARALADATAKGLRSTRKQDAKQNATWSDAKFNAAVGLYTGDAGVGHAFLVRHALRKDADSLAMAVEVGDSLLARAKQEHGGITWGVQPDLIVGNAGTALFLLELGQASGHARFLQGAQQAAAALDTTAVREKSTVDDTKMLPTWLYRMGKRSMHMPNFSHGTAGVAYALLRIGAAVEDQALIAAGKAGAEWMIEHTVEDGEGCKWPHTSPGATMFQGGWCHGPAGTGRLFLLLHSMTGEQRYLDLANKGARFMVDYADKARQRDAQGQAQYVPPSYCCGVAGVLEYFCDLHRVTHDPAHADYAKRAGQYLLDIAIADGDGRKWKNGRSVPGPKASDAEGHNIDLMIGAAGEAFALLQLLTIEAASPVVRGLPDRAIAAGRKTK
jgi:lantibiotic modifying enzyme